MVIEHTLRSRILIFRKKLISSILKNAMHLKYLKIDYLQTLPSFEKYGQKWKFSFLYRTSILANSCTGGNMFIKSKQSLSHRSGQDNSAKQVLWEFLVSTASSTEMWHTAGACLVSQALFIFWDMILLRSKYNQFLSFP